MKFLFKIYPWCQAFFGNMRKVKLVICRHGESEWNKLNLFCSWYDANLTEKGRQDAVNNCADALLKENIQFDCAYASALKRTQQTLEIILRTMNCCNIPVKYDWRLNERHYGALIGYNKREMADEYGLEQIQKWRRSYDACPPPITPDHIYYQHIRYNPSFADVPLSEFPGAESMKMMMERTIPMFNEEILPNVLRGKRVLIVTHSTVARGLIKYIDKIPDEDIMTVNIPNSIPCVYEYDLDRGIKVGQIRYLADEDFLREQMEKTASIGE